MLELTDLCAANYRVFLCCCCYCIIISIIINTCGKHYYFLWGWWYRSHILLEVKWEQKRSWTHFVTLKILSSRRALSTLMPNEVPGFTAAQITSKILPTMTCKRSPFYRRQNISCILCGAAIEAESWRVKVCTMMAFLRKLQCNFEEKKKKKPGSNFLQSNLKKGAITRVG